MLILAMRRGLRTMRSLAALASAAIASCSFAQMPGEWKYTITTDATSIPADMRVNFPTVSFAACRTAEDFESANAFALQTLASSAARCKSSNIVRVDSKASQPKKLNFDFACDEGKTLSGRADAVIEAKRFVVALESRYEPAVSGVERVRQTMKAQYVGECKKMPDVDEVKVP
jgi:Protein of unknown function (DUF3617)